MPSKALLVLEPRQLALIYEEMGRIRDDPSYDESERRVANELYVETAQLLGQSH